MGLLLGLMLALGGDLILLPPKYLNSGSDPEREQRIFEEYVAYISGTDCFLSYDALLTVLDQQRRGGPESSLDELLLILTDADHRVVTFSAYVRGDQTGYKTDSEQVFLAPEQFYEQLAGKYCGADLDRRSFTRPPPRTADYDAILMPRRNGNPADGYKMRLAVLDGDFSMTDVEGGDVIRIDAADVLDARPAEPEDDFELIIITRAEIYYLKLKTPDSPWLKRLLDAY